MESIEILDRKFRLYIPEAEISAEVNRLAAELTRDYQGKDPLLMPILNVRGRLGEGHAYGLRCVVCEDAIL